MPHLGFFRSHTTSFDLPTELKKGPRKFSNSRPSSTARSASSSGSSLTSNDGSVKMPEGHKRLSLGLISPKTSSGKLSAHQTATLDVVIESPPLVFFGPASSSSGALLSGQLILQVHEEAIAIEDFKMRLVLEVIRKKPFHSHCAECTTTTNDLTTWNFLAGPATLRRGKKTRISQYPALTNESRRAHIPIQLPLTRPPASIYEGGALNG
jgi:hypothetical protein